MGALQLGDGHGLVEFRHSNRACTSEIRGHQVSYRGSG
jgi:hypothetical protein